MRFLFVQGGTIRQEKKVLTFLLELIEEIHKDGEKPRLNELKRDTMGRLQTMEDVQRTRDEYVSIGRAQ
jgi:hypothetical protein